MGYEYDYVFDWMVKKPNIPAQITSKNEDEKQNEGEVANQDPNAANSTGNNNT